jgi:hypothetical protein
MWVQQLIGSSLVFFLDTATGIFSFQDTMHLSRKRHEERYGWHP